MHRFRAALYQLERLRAVRRGQTIIALQDEHAANQAPDLFGVFHYKNRLAALHDVLRLVNKQTVCQMYAGCFPGNSIDIIEIQSYQEIQVYGSSMRDVWKGSAVWQPDQPRT